MSNLFGIFFLLYMLIIVIHGSIYSNTMQAIRKLKYSSKSKGANKKKVITDVAAKNRKMMWQRRIVWLLFVILFLIHMKLISNIKFPEDDFFINSVYLFVTVCVVLFILNWIFGARIIDKKVRFIERD